MSISKEKTMREEPTGGASKHLIKEFEQKKERALNRSKTEGCPQGQENRVPSSATECYLLF